MWKFNTSLLTNKEYIEKITGFWKFWQSRRSSFRNINIWWDIGKRKIKHLSIRFSKRLLREKRFLRQSLERELNQLSCTNTDNDNKDEIDRVKAELTEIDNAAILGAKIRSKERFYTENEKPSKYF